MAPSRPARDVACSLQKHLQGLYDVHRSPDRRSVNYNAMKGCNIFQQFEMFITELQTVDLSTLSFREKLAFWINLYNIMCIHMIVANGVPDGRFQRWTMQSAVKYNIGGQEYSIADVKHGVLRGNQKAPFSMWRQFGDGDPRRVHSLPIFDPRVHFTLCEGSLASPQLFLYHANSEIEAELTESARVFCQDLVSFDHNEKKVCLPEILKEFLEDFQCSEVDLVRKHLSAYCAGDQKEQCSSNP